VKIEFRNALRTVLSNGDRNDWNSEKAENKGAGRTRWRRISFDQIASTDRLATAGRVLMSAGRPSNNANMTLGKNRGQTDSAEDSVASCIGGISSLKSLPASDGEISL